MKYSLSLLLFTLQGILSFSQICQPTLDQTFGTNGVAVGKTVTGTNPPPYSNKILVQPDNKIIQLCRISEDYNYRFAVIRYNSNGSLDPTFGTNGTVITSVGAQESWLNTGIIQPDGKIIVAGSGYNATNLDFALVRYNSDGSLDNSFGSGGKLMTQVGLSNDFASGLALQQDGKIIAVGGSVDTGFVVAFATVRYNSNGSIDSSFGKNGKIVSHLGHFITYIYNTYYGVYASENAVAVAVQPDQKIIVAGNSYTYTDCYDYYGGIYCNPAFAMVRYNSDGSLDSTFGNKGKVVDSVEVQYLSSAVLQADGKILVTGNGWDVNGIRTNRYNSDGSPDSSFGINGKVNTEIGTYSSSHDIFYQPDGKILLGGYAYVNNSYDFVVVRYKSNGSLDSNFNGNGIASINIGQPGSEDEVTGVALQGNKIVVVGSSRYFGGSVSSNSARLVAVRLLDVASVLYPIITPAGPFTICQGQNIILSSSETGSFEWYKNNEVINGATGSTYTVTANGNYMVRVSNANGCGVSAPVSVVVNSNPPTPTITYEDNPYQFSTSVGYSAYQWYFNSNVIAGATSSAYTPTQTGLYNVQVTDANNCSSTSLTYNLVVLATGDLIVGDAKLRVYPNPVHSMVYVEIERLTGKKLIAELFDLNGRLLQKQLLNQSHNEISVGKFQAGLYLLVVSDNKVKAVRKVTVVK